MIPALSYRVFMSKRVGSQKPQMVGVGMKLLPQNACREYAGKILIPEKYQIKSNSPVVFHVAADRWSFPDTSVVTPARTRVAFRINMNSRLFANAVHGFTGRHYIFDPDTKPDNVVTVSFIDSNSPILFEDSKNRRALVMPVYRNEDQ
jgi:hypothetical protein